MPMAEEVYAPIIDTNLTLPLALAQVCSIARAHSLLRRGFRQVSSIIMREKAKFVLLAKDNDEKSSAIISALCRDREIPIIMVDDRKELGKTVGLLSRSDSSRVCPCGVASVLDYGKNSEGKVVVINALRDISANK